MQILAVVNEYVCGHGDQHESFLMVSLMVCSDPSSALLYQRARGSERCSVVQPDPGRPAARLCRSCMLRYLLTRCCLIQEARPGVFHGYQNTLLNEKKKSKSKVLQRCLKTCSCTYN